MRYLFAVLMCLVGVAFAERPALRPQELPAGLREALQNATTAELYSLDPQMHPPAGEEFNGWRALGETPVSGPEAQEICHQLLEGMANTDGMRLACFNPRHGLRVNGFDLIICFECGQFGIAGNKGLFTIRKGSAVCQAAVLRHGLPWPHWFEQNGRHYEFSGVSVELLPKTYSYSEEGRLVADWDFFVKETMLLPQSDSQVLALQLEGDAKSIQYLIVQLFPDLTCSFDPATKTLTCRGSADTLAQLVDKVYQPPQRRSLALRVFVPSEPQKEVEKLKQAGGLQFKPLGKYTLAWRATARDGEVAGYVTNGKQYLCFWARLDSVAESTAALESVLGTVRFDSRPVAEASR